MKRFSDDDDDDDGNSNGSAPMSGLLFVKSGAHAGATPLSLLYSTSDHSRVIVLHQLASALLVDDPGAFEWNLSCLLHALRRQSSSSSSSSSSSEPSTEALPPSVARALRRLGPLADGHVDYLASWSMIVVNANMPILRVLLFPTAVARPPPSS